MTMSLLSGYIGLLVVLFIIAIAVIALAAMRARNAGTKVQSGNDPIPDISRRNYQTRVDKQTDEVRREIDRDTDNSYSGAVPHRDDGSRS